MAWDFETDPEFQKKLDWIEDFMRDEVEHVVDKTGQREHFPVVDNSLTRFHCWNHNISFLSEK